MSKEMRYTLQDNYLMVVVDGKPFSLNSSHPTFQSMKNALERKRWTSIPKLINVASTIHDQTHGSVKVEGGKVFYKGRVVDTSLTRRIVALVKENKPVASVLKFMDNLYKNPSQDCIRELHDFMQKYSLPITDDGCFMAYKAVNADYTDCYSSTVDNSVGRVVTMARGDVDADRRTLCSSGYHFCSLVYLQGFRGAKIMGIKINPKDVVSIPELYEGKGRTWRYEVVYELADKNPITSTTEAEIFKTTMIPVESDRKKLLEKVLAHPVVRRALKNRKLKAANLRKGTLGRLMKLYARLPLTEVPKQSKLYENPIKVAREQASLRLIEVAEEMDITPKEVYDSERFANAGQAKIDAFLRAIQTVAARKAKSTYATA